MKFELKTGEDNFSKYFFSTSFIVFLFSLTLIIYSIFIKVTKISRYYEINYLCKLLIIDKSPAYLKRLSKLTNQSSKQKMLNLCKEINRNYQLEAEEQNLKAYIQNLLETIKNIPETNISNNIFHIGANPRISSEGIEVINAIGIKILKKILIEKENEFNGNLPI